MYSHLDFQFPLINFHSTPFNQKLFLEGREEFHGTKVSIIPPALKG